MPYGWEAFYELLGLFTLYSRHPEALAHGHQGARVMFSPPGHVSKEGFFGIDGLRIFYRRRPLRRWSGSLPRDVRKVRWRRP